MRVVTLVDQQQFSRRCGFDDNLCPAQHKVLQDLQLGLNDLPKVARAQRMEVYHLAKPVDELRTDVDPRLFHHFGDHLIVFCHSVLSLDSVPMLDVVIMTVYLKSIVQASVN